MATTQHAFADFGRTDTLNASFSGHQGIKAIKNKIQNAFDIEPHQGESSLFKYFKASKSTDWEEIKRVMREASRPTNLPTTTYIYETPPPKEITVDSYKTQFLQYDDSYIVSDKMAKEIGGNTDFLVQKTIELSNNQFMIERDVRMLSLILGGYTMTPTVSADSASSSVEVIPYKSFIVGLKRTQSSKVYYVPDYRIFQTAYAHIMDLNKDAYGNQLGVRADLTAAKYVAICSTQAHTSYVNYNISKFGHRDYFGKELLTSNFGTVKMLGPFPMLEVTSNVMDRVATGTGLVAPKAADGTGGNIAHIGSTGTASHNTTLTAGPAPANTFTGTTSLLAPSWNASPVLTGNTADVTADGLQFATAPNAATDISPQGMHYAILVPTALFKFMRPAQLNTEGWDVWPSEQYARAPQMYRKESIEALRCFADRIVIVMWTPTGVGELADSIFGAANTYTVAS